MTSVHKVQNSRGGMVLTDVYTGETHFVSGPPFWDNDETWTTREGEVLKIDEMRYSHIERVIQMLEKIDRRLHRAAQIDMMEFGDGPLGPGGDMATMAFDEALNELLWMDPGEWLDQTPLMVKLRETLRKKRKPRNWTGYKPPKAEPRELVYEDVYGPDYFDDYDPYRD